MKEHFLCGAQGLAIGYGKTPLLSDICLRVQPGQILTLIGPNGAGKSTLLRTLAGQLAPMGGTVLLEGRSLASYTGTQRAQKLALMAPHSRILTASATASASASCWPGPCASSRK